MLMNTRIIYILLGVYPFTIIAEDYHLRFMREQLQVQAEQVQVDADNKIRLMERHISEILEDSNLEHENIASMIDEFDEQSRKYKISALSGGINIEEQDELLKRSENLSLRSEKLKASLKSIKTLADERIQNIKKKIEKVRLGAKMEENEILNEMNKLTLSSSSN